MSEKIIIVDDNDESIGFKERSRLDHPNDTYRCSSLWVTNSDGRILLSKRSMTKANNPGVWQEAVAGTVEKGETYDSNVAKEMDEELGLKDIKIMKGPKIHVRLKRNFFRQIYFAILDLNETEFVLQEEEVERVKWFTKEEIKENYAKDPEAFQRSFKLIWEAVYPEEEL